MRTGRSAALLAMGLMITGCSLISTVDELSSGGTAGAAATPLDASQEDVSSVVPEASSDVVVEDASPALDSPIVDTSVEADGEGSVAEAEVGVEAAPDVAQDPSSEQTPEPQPEAGKDAEDAEAQTGDSGCTGATKDCNGQCVSLTDPAYGCTATSCTPCALPHASAVCQANACAVALCSTNYGDCDNQAGTGCETDITTTTQHCGECGKACTQAGPNQTPSCAASQCGASCVSGWGDCNSVQGDGCETGLTSDTANCGSCGHVCPSGGAHQMAQCENGTCKLICTASYADCNGSSLDGCEASLLTDPLHCGGCNHSCLALTCAQGSCVPGVLSSGLTSPWGIAVDATNIYFTTRTSQGSLYRQDKTGATAATVVATNLELPTWLVLNSTHAFWTTEATVGKVQRLATQSLLVVDIVAAGGAKAGLALDDTRVFWTDTVQGRVEAANLDGTGLTVLASSQNSPTGIAVDVLSTASVYWINAGDGGLWRVSKDGTGALLLSQQSAWQGAVALQGDVASLFFTVGGAGGAVWTRSKTNPGTPAKLTPNQASPAGLALDSSTLYWCNRNDGTVQRLSKSGGSPTLIASGQNDPVGIAVDSQYVYWVNHGSGTVMRALKK